MRIAVASGKGGTGKTTLSIAFALSSSNPLTLLDCDVEEPNCSLFLKTCLTGTEKVFIAVPEIDESLCRHCGECSRICQFNALASLGKKTLVFEELCHSCGACAMICPERAISEKKKEIGIIESGSMPNLKWRMAAGWEFTNEKALASIRESFRAMSRRASCRVRSCIFIATTRQHNAPS